MNWQDRIITDSKTTGGKPVIKGSNIAVGFVLDLLAKGRTEADILRSHPSLTHDDIIACLQYARDLAEPDPEKLGRAGEILAGESWPREDFSDWERKLA